MTLRQTCASQPTCFKRGVRQGSPEAGIRIVIGLAVALSRMQVEWKTKAWGKAWERPNGPMRLC